MVQNSLQTFIYSVYRGGQEVHLKNYMPNEECDAIFPIRKVLPAYDTGSAKKNIVLFIMESVPYDFFDSGSRYKVRQPRNRASTAGDVVVMLGTLANPGWSDQPNSASLIRAPSQAAAAAPRG